MKLDLLPVQQLAHLSKGRWWLVVQRHPPAALTEPLERHIPHLGFVSGVAPWDYPASHHALLVPLQLFHVGWYSQQQPGEYPEGLQNPGNIVSYSETHWFFISPPSQRKRVWKGQSNLVIQQMVTGLVPQPGVWLLRPWDLLWETWSKQGWWEKHLRSWVCPGGEQSFKLEFLAEETLSLSHSSQSDGSRR